MVLRFRLFAMLIALLVCRGVAQTDSQTATSETDSRVISNLEVLSDTHGVDFGPYLSRVVQAVRTNWYHLIPDEARAPHLKKGKVFIEFAILPDGRVADMKLTGESGDVSLDRAAWGGITASVPFQPLPSEYHGPYLLLRFHFYYNPAPGHSQDANTLFANASSAVAMNDCGSAIPLAIRVTGMYPQHTAAWNLLGLCYLELDELKKAEDAFQRQIEVSPQSTFAYNNLGRVYARQRKFDMAIAQFRKQIEINPRDRYAHMNLAGSLHSEQKCDQAIPEYQLAVELTPENAGPHVGLARCYLDQGKQDSGVAEVDKAAALTSTGPGWNALAWTLAEHKIQLDRAEQYARLAVSMDSASLTAVSLDPLTPGAYARTRALGAAWDTLGWILFLRGDFAPAEKYIMASWTLMPNPTVSDHLAQISEKLGRKDDALKYSAIAVAEGEVPSEGQDSDGNAVANSRERLARLAPSSAASDQISQDAQPWLERQNSFALPNPAKHAGSAEFALLRAHGQSSAKARWIAGDPALKDFESEVAAGMPAGPADVGGIDVLRWGALSCEQPDAECKFQLSSAREAVYAHLRSTVKPETAATDSTGVAISPALSNGVGSTSANPQQVQIGQAVSQGLLISKVQPTYPPLARQARVQGTVVLEAVIGKDGSVQDLQVFSGHPLLIQAAMDAVKQWRYKPYLLNGEPVSVETTINVNFELSGAPSEAQPNEPATTSNSSSLESVSSNPPQAQQAGQGPSSDQYPGVYRVGGDVAPPKATYAPDPQYSEKARQAGYEGTVVLWLVVDANGLPQEIKVQHSLGMGLDEEAIKAVRQWRFQPALKDGKPIPVMVNVQVNFRLDGKPGVQHASSPSPGGDGSAVTPALSGRPPASAPGSSPQQVQIGQAVSQGLLISKVQPTYPPLARQARVQGTVVLHAVIGKDGSVQDLQVVSGHPMLIQAAMDAVKQWRYKPYLLMGKPVQVQTTINVNFELSNGPSEAQPSEQATAAENSSSQSGSSGPPQMPPAGQKAASDPSQEAYIIERNATKVVYNADGSGSREAMVAMRVQSQAGVQELAVLTFRYTSYNETVEVDYVRVRKPDGTVVVTPDSNVQDMSAEVTRSAPMYSDVHEKHVAVKALGIGDVLEYAVRYRTVKPQVPGQFWYEYNFYKRHIAKDEELEISVPRDKYVKVESPDYKPEIKDEGARRIYTWKTSNLIVKNREDMLNAREAPAPSVQVTTFRDWAEVGSWYEQLQRPQMAVTPQIQAKAAELTKGLATDEDKIRAIYNYVSTGFHYVSLSFGIGRYQPHAAEDVLENEYGDCKDKHTLLATLLKAAGFDAWPALINSSRKIDPAVPSPGQFDHVITVVPRGVSIIWLDTTPEVSPFRFLTANLRDRKALVIPTAMPASLMETESQPPFPLLQTFNADGALSADGTLTAKVQQTARGDIEVMFRMAFRGTPAAQWKELGQRISYGEGFSGEVSNLTASAPDQTDKPFQFSYDYSKKSFGDWDSHRIVAPLPWFGFESSALDEKPPAEPLVLGSLGELVYKSKTVLPPGLAPAYSEKMDLSEDFADYHASYTIANGALIADRRLVIKKSEVPLAEWEKYKKFRKALAEERDRFIDLDNGTTQYPPGEKPLQAEVAKAATTPDAKAIQEGVQAEQQIQEALQRNDTTTAEEIARRLLEKYPKQQGVHALMGYVYIRKNDSDRGMAEFLKEEELHPGNVGIYKTLAAYYMDAHRDELAARSVSQVAEGRSLQSGCRPQAVQDVER